MKRTTSRVLSLNEWFNNGVILRGYASFPERLREELTCRQLPLSFDYLHPQPSHLLDLTLRDFFSKPGQSPATRATLPTITRPQLLPAAHHLVYFPPQLALSQLLPDGTDNLHCPGAPYNRRLWAGGSIKLAPHIKLMLDGSRAVCIEGIRDLIVKGPPGEEKIIVRVERQIGLVREHETEEDIRKRVWNDGQDIGAHTSLVETRNLVFMRDKSPTQLDQDKAKFSQASKMIRCV